MHQLENMKDTLVSCVQSQMSDLQRADTKELGEVIDMIKDLSETIYYCTITEAMKEKEPSYESRMYYGDNGYGVSRDISGMSRPRSAPSTSYYTEYPYSYPYIMDNKEGRSALRRKMYMESKEMNQDRSVQLKELENYAQDLSDDVTEMLQDATPDERQFLEKKMAAIANKIAQMRG